MVNMDTKNFETVFEVQAVANVMMSPAMMNFKVFIFLLFYGQPYKYTILGAHISYLLYIFLLGHKIFAFVSV